MFNKNTNKSRAVKALNSLILLLFFSVFVTAQTFTGGGFTFTDATGAITCGTINVSGITSNVSVRSVSFNGLTHTWIGDTQLFLRPPGGTPQMVITSPPDGRSCNFSGNYTFIDTAAQSIDAATAGCTTSQNVAAGNYRTSNYGGGTANGTVTSITSFYGPLTPAQANGAWQVCGADFSSGDTGALTSSALTLVPLSASSAQIRGRVVNASGRGLVKATVKIIDASTGQEYTRRTSSFGYFTFENLTVGNVYVVTVASKKYTFSARTISLTEDLGDLVITPEETVFGNGK